MTAVLPSPPTRSRQGSPWQRSSRDRTQSRRIAKTTAGQTTVHVDDDWSVIAEYLDSTGAVIAHFEYDPFGNTVTNTDTAELFNYKFSTIPLDSETGFYYYGYRYYDPLTGRWPS